MNSQVSAVAPTPLALSAGHGARGAGAQQGPPSPPPTVPGATQGPGSNPGTAKTLPSKEVRDQLRQTVQDATGKGEPQIVIPNDFTNAVPRGAVQISIGFFAAVAAAVILGPIARAFARRLDARSRALSDAGRNVMPQIQQLQESVDTIAVELERISEAQRFQSKLLAGGEASGAATAQRAARPG